MSFSTISSSALGFQAIVQGSSQKIITSGSSLSATPFAAATTIIRIFCTQDTYIQIGENPTATSSSMFMPGGIIEYFAIQPGYGLAALQVSMSGNVYITEGR